jgi:glutaredoxin
MVWAWLRSWWGGRRLRHWQVVMYTRRGCHLCERAWEQLEQARRQHGFALSQVDVDGEPELVRQYGECVPVVTVNGRVRFRGVVNPVLLRRLLRASP